MDKYNDNKYSLAWYETLKSGILVYISSWENWSIFIIIKIILLLDLWFIEI